MDLELATLLSQPPDPERPYVYRGTRSRINKFGILNPDALDSVVRTLTGLRGELLRVSPIEGDFDWDHLSRIHHFLFQDVYHWAGQVRVIDFNSDSITEGNKRVLPFSEPETILAECDQVFFELRGENQLRGLSQDVFADRLTYYLYRLMVIHPFRDGNGRSVRAFFEQLARENGWRFELGTIPVAERHSSATEADNGDMKPLRELIGRVVSPL